MKIQHFILAASVALPFLATAEIRHRKGEETAPNIDATNQDEQRAASTSKSGSPKNAAINARPIFSWNLPPHPKDKRFTPDKTGASICETQHGLDSLLQEAPTNIEAIQNGVFYLQSDKKGLPQIYQQTSPQGAPELVQAYEFGVKRFALSRDGKFLVAVENRNNGLSQLHLLDLKKRKSQKIGQLAKVLSMQWTPNGGLYFSGIDIKEGGVLYKFDKNTLTLQSKGALQYIEDSLPSTKDNILVLTEQKTWLDREIVKITNWPKLKGTQLQLASSADGAGLFVLSDLGGAVNQISYHSLGQSLKGAKARILHTGPDNADLMYLNSNRDLLAYTTNAGGFSHLRILRLDAHGRLRHEISPPPLPQGVIHELTLDKTHHSLFFVYSSPIHPKALYSWDAKSLVRWTPIEVNYGCLHIPTPITINSKNIKVPAWLYQSPKQPTKGAVVMLREELTSQYRPSFDGAAQYLVERGYSVLIPNVRGSSGYTRKYSTLDDKKKRLNVVEDIYSSASWLVKKQIAKPDNLFLAATGYSGFLGIKAIEKKPSQFRATALIRPWVSLQDVVTAVNESERPFLENELGTLAFLKTLNPSEERLVEGAAAVLFLSTATKQWSRLKTWDFAPFQSMAQSIKRMVYFFDSSAKQKKKGS